MALFLHRTFVRVAAFGLVFAGLSAVPACAGVLGFEDALDLTDAADATAIDAAEEPTDRDAAMADSDMGSDAPDVVVPPTPCTATCVPAAPQGWDGPFAYFEASGGPPAPPASPCGGAYATTAYDGTGDLVAPPATCGCTCADPVNIGCAAPIVNLFSDNACTVSCGTKNQPLTTDPTCTVLGIAGCSGTHMVIGDSLPTGGSCAAQPSSTVVPSAWSTTYRLCAATAPPAGSCEDGKVCAASPSLPQRPGTLCVAKPGDVSCPGGYPVKKTAYASSVDTRACTACTCGTPTGASCPTRTVTTNSDLACASGPKILTVPQTCVATTAKSADVSAAVPTGGACAPANSTPTGAATPTSPTTICCSM